MQVLQLPSALLVVTSLALPAPAQGEWSTAYDRPGLVGRVFALGEYQGELHAGGLPLQADGEVSLGLVTHFDGSQWRPMGSGVLGEEVRAFATYQGELVVAGEFTVAGGHSVHSVARWDGSQWSPMGAGLDLSFASTGRVMTLAEFQGQLYAGGDFDLAGGQAAANLARWDGTQWQPVGSVSGIVWSLLAAPDGNLYVAGDFGQVSGVPSTGNLARYDGTNFSALGGGLPGASGVGVREVVWYQGELWAGGAIEVAGGALDEKLARFDGSSWHAAGVFPDSSISTRIECLEVWNGELYAAGNIVSASGVGVDRIARWSGSSWSSIGGVGADQTTVVMDMTVQAGKLVLGGEMDRAGFDIFAAAPTQSVATESVATFDGGAWGTVSTGQGFSARPKDLLAWSGDLLAVGSFQHAGEVLNHDMVRFDGSRWSAFANCGGTPEALGLFQGDLVVAGAITSVDGVPVQNVARFDGSQWSPLGSGAMEASVLAEYQGELYVGGLGGVQRLVGGTWQPLPTPLFGFVYDLHVHAGLLYIGGSMFGVNNLVAFDGTDVLQVAGGTNGTVRALGTFGNELLVGGTFSQAGGVATGFLARYDGSSFQPFGGGLTGTEVTAIGTFQDQLYLGGNLFVPGFPPEKYVARWDGSSFHPLGGGLQGNAMTFLGDDAAGRLYMAGVFTRADTTGGGGLPSWYFAEWITAPGEEPWEAYCISKVNSLGCVPTMTASGAPSLSSLAPFEIRGENVLSSQNGVLFYGFDQDLVPFLGGFRCIALPVRRTPLSNSAGNPPGDCSGVLRFDFNAWAQGGNDPLLLPGTEIYCQYWYRDPADAVGVGLTEGLTFTLQP